MNLRELFNAHHNGFDNFGAWYEHHKAMHAKHPLECAEFGAEWLRRWEQVGRLLERPARIASYGYKRDDGRKRWSKATEGSRGSLGQMLLLAIEPGRVSPSPIIKNHKAVRIVLLDGTIVKEWGAT